MEETIKFTNGEALGVINGSAGLATQAPGAAATVGNAASATGGVAAGNLIEPDIDEQLFLFQSEDTALMSMMLKSKKVKVHSPEVEHYMIDGQTSEVVVTEAVSKGGNAQFALPLSVSHQSIPHVNHTLLVRGVSGYTEDGQQTTPGKDLMLYVTGTDAATGNPIVRAINGPKNGRSDLYCTTPAIPAGTRVRILANALYETQKEVEPDLIVPKPETIYLQKRGMNQIVSDYFDAQRKHVPFTQSVIAEQAILNFKRAGNRTLWAGRKGKLQVKVPKLGDQLVYFTEGLRWQFKREVMADRPWTIEKVMALAKLFYTGEDVPRSATILAGKNLLEQLQYIDFTSHPEVHVMAAHNPLGWAVTRIHTVFGDIDIKREPTLDTLGWSNSGALIANDRLVHYTYSTQHEFTDRVEGEEATRRGMVVWDALALKGTCHIWINGEGDGTATTEATYELWDSTEEPSGDDLREDCIYYFVKGCKAIGASSGSTWTFDGEEWSEC
ncbi:MAG: hypothetical protein NC102_10050 [Clostridium sp.]|nr:hypothetical protein [Clostridium sp.]